MIQFEKPNYKITDYVEKIIMEDLYLNHLKEVLVQQ